MKKLSFRGFTLVELMIVIAIIGILAAVLYPSMTGYFERSRDTNRQGALRNVSLALGSYMVDKDAYPAMSTDTCATAALSGTLASYIQQLPSDPKSGYGISGCTTGTAAGRGYGYITVNDAYNNASGAYILGARIEVVGNANLTGSTLSSTLSSEKIGTGKLLYVGKKVDLGLSQSTATGVYVVGQ